MYSGWLIVVMSGNFWWVCCMLLIWMKVDKYGIIVNCVISWFVMSIMFKISIIIVSWLLVLNVLKSLWMLKCVIWWWL